MTAPESPDILTDGSWKPCGAVLVWVPSFGSWPERDQRLLVACPTCHARIDQLCRSKTGRHRFPHASRLVPKRCGCGAVLAHNKKLCEVCRAAARRENSRRGMRNTRARRRAAREAA